MIRITLLIAVALAGCSTTPPTIIEYLLRPDASNAGTSLDRSTTVALGRVTTAPYLDRDGIVLESLNHQVTVARNHRWAEALSQSIRRTLQVEIGRSAGFAVGDAPVNSSGYQVLIDVDIHQFHGSVSGTAKLIANWRLRQARSNEIHSSHAFSRQTTLSADGYDALVQTQIDLLADLAAAIANSLSEDGAQSHAKMIGSTTARQ